MNSISIKVRLLLTILTCVFMTFTVSAQTPTAEQMTMFKSLPQSQQQALANQYGIELPTGLGSSSKPQYKSINIMSPRPITAKSASNQNSSTSNKLMRYGVKLFSASPTTFAPLSDVPVPANYQISAGDEIIIQLFGKDNSTHRLVVNREGSVNFPSLGPISVSGMHFSKVKEVLKTRVKEQMIGVRSDISMGKMRSMQVFVMGDAYKPGAYTVSGLTTISQAIYYSGGFAESGALRDIQLKRDGKLIRRLDMYDILLHGDTSNDVRLLSGDVVFIGPVKQTVSLEGEINRPAIYEIKNKETVADVVAMAGGIKANAVSDRVFLTRTVNNGSREVLTVNLSDDVSKSLLVQNGDEITFNKRNAELQRFIKINGAVQQPGYQQWQSGMRISDVFLDIDTAVNSSADVHYSLVVREVNAQRDIQVLQFDLSNALSSPNSSDNIMLKSRDNIVIFNRFNDDRVALLDDDKIDSKSFEQARELALNEALESDIKNNGSNQLTEANINSIFQSRDLTVNELKRVKGNTRRALLTPILMKLEQQAKFGLPALIAEVSGEVKYPGLYPISATKYSVESLLTAAGGLTSTAYIASAELARANDDGSKGVEILHVDLQDVISGGTKNSLVIAPNDRLNIFAQTKQKQQSKVVLQGEVRFPGTYTVRRGESLNSLLNRAGGLTEFAHPQGAVFTREALRLQEQKLLNDYAAEMRKETARKTFRADSNTGSTISEPDKTLAFVEEASKSKALGRMVVELSAINAGETSADFILEDGDFLFVPTFRNTVSIMGEVQVAITYLLDEQIDVDEYINKAGGIKKQADEDRIFVVRADGSVYKPNSGYWFGASERLKPGDTIVVPLDTDYRDALSTWTAATQILYQTGVAFKALN